MPITTENLAAAAEHGTGLAHLSPSQAWATHHLKLAPDQLTKPLRTHIAALLERTSDMASRRFIEGGSIADPISIITRAYDPEQPAWLRLPIQRDLQQQSEASFPDSRGGTEAYCLEDIAAASDISVEELLALAREQGRHLSQKHERA